MEPTLGRVMADEIAEQPATIEATVRRLRPLAAEIRALVG